MNRDLPHTPARRTTIIGLVRGSVAAALVLLLGVSGLSPAQADELDDRKVELQAEIAQQAAVIDDAQAQKDAAAAAARQARSQLADAESRLASAEAEVQAAEDIDRQRAAELADAVGVLDAANAALDAANAALEAANEALEQANADLALAKAEVAAAKAALDSVNRRLNEEILVTTQSSAGLANLALIFTDVDASNLNQRAQLAQTLMSSSAAQLDELEMRRVALEDAEIRADQAQKAADQAQKEADQAQQQADELQQAADAAHQVADAARRAAADHLAQKQYVQGQAQNLRAEVADLVVARDRAEVQAKDQVAQEERRQRELQSESVAVEQRIQERIAAQKKAAAEKAAREKAAREKAAREKAEREAEAKRQADEKARREAEAQRQAEADRINRAARALKTSAAAPAPAPAAQQRSEIAEPVRSSTSATRGSGFIRPVQGRLTSQYGMRLHPVLGYRKLHDGTDFAAACGTPLRAAAAGVVTERYYNGGYGHRLMIDHGLVNGSYVTTGYNHATHYIVGVGTRVSQGQIVGYVGSTGYSTGCHLHLMVWDDGRVVNPMAYWFK